MYTLHLKKNKYLVLLLSLIFFTPTIIWALSDDVEKPVNIEANYVVFDNNKGIADYEGNVIITQGSLQILADSVHIQAPGHEISMVIAFGSPVKLRQEMDDGEIIKGQGKKMTYDVENKIMILTEDAKLEQGRDIIINNYIKYLPDTGKLHAGGQKNSGRVKATFHPTNKADKNKKDPANR